MSTYADFIAEVRAEVGDFPTNRYETADSDGGTSRFVLANPKIYENNSNESVQVGGVMQALTTAYTIDRNIGQIAFTNGHIPTSGNDNVSFQYQSVNFLDSDYIVMTNEVLRQLRKKFGIEFEDSTSLTSSTDTNNYSLAAVKTAGGFTDIVYLSDIEIKLVGNSPTPPSQEQLTTNPWRSLRTITNAVYYRDLQEIRIRPALVTAGMPLRVKGFRAYVQGTTVGATFEPQQRYWPVIKKFVQATYLERFALQMLRETSAVSKEKAFENATEMRKLAIDVRREATDMLKEVRPPKPAKAIPIAILGVNI